MPLNIIRNDITRVSADAIVNTANPQVAVGAGVDQAIYEAAGAEQLLAERAKIGPMQPGQAAVTPAFALDAKYIIHTVGPVWRGGSYGEREAVASCYRESLRLADDLHCSSIAFPLISTGTYGFPKDEALKIAISEISDFLFSHDMDVYMVVYSREAFVISSKTFADIKSYIEDKDVKLPAYGAANRADYDTSYSESRLERDAAGSRREKRLKRLTERLPGRRRTDPTVYGDSAPHSAGSTGGTYSDNLEASAPIVLEDDDIFDEQFDQALPSEYEMSVDQRETMELSAPAANAFHGTLEELLDQRTETFQQMLFRIIDRKDLTDPEVYKKANLDRKLFSKIRSNVNYVPSKKTVLALAVALELNMDETIDLLRRAGLALSPTSRFDLIVGYCIDHKIYNVFEINAYLFDYDQPLLGA